jgi:hypothetical protein
MQPRVRDVLVLITVAIVAFAVLAVATSSSAHPIACGTGSDLEASVCRDAKQNCLRETDARISADGDGFSYLAECTDGELVSFTWGGP